MIAVTSLQFRPRTPLKRMVATVIGDERAQQADEADSRPDLVHEAAGVGTYDVQEQAPDADPYPGEDGGEEQEDHTPVVPRTVAVHPQPVVPCGEDDDQYSREDARPDLLGEDRDPEGENDRRSRQVLGQLAP
jgi:hypothetical protein